MSNSSIWHIDRILSGAATTGQSEPESDVNEGVFHIPRSSRTGALPSDCLVLYPGHSRNAVNVFYSPSRQNKQNLVSYLGHSLGVGWGLPLCKDAVDVFYNPSKLGQVLLQCRDAVIVFSRHSRLCARFFSVLSWTLVDWSFTPQQGCSQCILQPQPTVLQILLCHI